MIIRYVVLGLALALAGCAAAAGRTPAGPEAVPAEVRMQLRLSVVGLAATRLLLYGGAEQDVFLGCLTCEKMAPTSIFNPQGRYGSTTAEASIWNAKGPYGEHDSPLSPWNPHGTHPPMVRDEHDRRYGYFTANPDLPGRVHDQATLIFLKSQAWR